MRLFLLVNSRLRFGRAQYIRWVVSDSWKERAMTKLKRCAGCETRFMPTRNQLQLYCCIQCREKTSAKKKNPLVVKQCAEETCGKLFTCGYYSSPAARRFCCKTCASREWIRMNRDRSNEYGRNYKLRNPEKIIRARLQKAAKLKAANEILKWAREQGVYNG